MLRLRTNALALLLLGLGLFSGVVIAQSPPLPSSSETLREAPQKDTAAISSAIGLEQFQARVVRDIQLRGVSQEEGLRNWLRGMIAQGINQPLDRQKIRHSIQALYATGRFDDIRVEGERTGPNEVTLVFYFDPSFFIGEVTVDGLGKRPTANQLINASKLNLGSRFSRERITNAIENMKTVMADHGYYQAEITEKEEFHPARQQVDIHFHVLPYRPAQIGEVTIRGNPGLTIDQIRRIADIEAGHTVTAQRARNAVEKLRKRYQKKNRLAAQVAIIDRVYHPESNTLDYVLRINQGPDVKIEVQGAKLSRGKLKKYVPVFEEGAVDDDLLNEGRRNLRDYFQTQGYFSARVDFERHRDRQERRVEVVYKVDLGSRRKLEAIQISGNKYFSTDMIRERMQIRPVSGVLTRGLYSEQMLSRDLNAIVALYRNNGFQQVEVTSRVEGNYQGSSEGMVVAVQIKEGAQSVVNLLQITGSQAIPEQDIRQQLQTAEGQPFSEAAVSADAQTVLNYYYDRGFSDASFEWSSKPELGNPNLINVTFHVREGKQVFVDRVLVSGLNFTRTNVVDRQIELKPQAPLSQANLLKSQQQLYDLGIFNEVDAAVQNPDGDSRYKNVLFVMHEARRWTFNYGLGFEVQTGQGNPRQINTAPAPGVSVPPGTTPPTNVLLVGGNPGEGAIASPRVSFEVTRLNFRGRNHTLLMRTHLGDLQKRGLVSYEAPRWFNNDNLRLTFTAFYDNSRDVRTFTSTRVEGSTQMEQKVGRASTLLYRLTYRRVSVDANSLAISPDLVPLLSRPVRVSMPSFTYIRDRRDDPLEPHRGSYTTFDTGVAAKPLGSATSFARFTLQNSSYWSFGKAPTIDRKYVFARMTRIGMAQPFGGEPSTSAIPLPERFFGGGANSHRGFALNQAGPRDLTTGFPLGGDAVFVNSLELRMPPPELPYLGTNLRFVLFHDMGNVFENGSDMLSGLGRWHQPGRNFCSIEATHEACGFNYTSHAVGIGARYKTPIGPVRLDVSYNLNPVRFPFYVQCPAAGTANVTGPCATLPPSSLIFQAGSLRHINFFFSIGESF